MPNSRLRRSPRRPTGRTRPTRATTDSITTTSLSMPDDATSSCARTSFASEKAGSNLQTFVESPGLSTSDSFTPGPEELYKYWVEGALNPGWADEVIRSYTRSLDFCSDEEFLAFTESSNKQSDQKPFACASWNVELEPPRSEGVDISGQSHQLPSPPESNRSSPSSFPSCLSKPSISSFPFISPYLLEDGSYGMGTEEAAPNTEFVCEQHGMSFRRKADLERHVAKEKKVFTCEVPDCPARKDGKAFRFGSLSDKKRHYYEVHHQDLAGNPLQLHYCPWSNCNRHGKGFTRPANLAAHIRSRHDGKTPRAEQDPITPVASPRVETTDGPSRQAVVSQQQKSPNPNGNKSTYGSALERNTHSYETHNEFLSWGPEGIPSSERAYNGNTARWQSSLHNGLVLSSVPKLDPLTEVPVPGLGPPDVADVLSLSLQNDDEVMQAYLEDFHGSYAQLKDLEREMNDLQDDLKRRQMELKRKQEQYIGLRTVVDYEGNKVRKRKAARRNANETAGSAMRTNHRDESTFIVDSRLLET